MDELKVRTEIENILFEFDNNEEDHPEKYIEQIMAVIKVIPIEPPVKPATAEDAIRVIESIADKTRGTWSRTYDGFDITKDRLKLISQIKRTIKKQLSV